MNSTPDAAEDFAGGEGDPEDQPESPAFADPDPSLFEAHDLARAALLEITPESTVGAPVGHSIEAEGVVSLYFATTLEGYPGWHWAVAVTRVEGSEPTVLEVGLQPGDGALLAPDWLPWAERLAEYQALQAAAAAERALSDVDDVDSEVDEELEADLEDLDDLDAADFDEDGSPTLHAGDLDGVDIDVLDEDADDEDDDEDVPDDDADDDADDEDVPDDEAPDGEDDEAPEDDRS